MNSLAALNDIQIDVNRIKELIPHRYPFLLIDGIKTLVPNESAVGIKNVSVKCIVLKIEVL